MEKVTTQKENVFANEVCINMPYLANSLEEDPAQDAQGSTTRKGHISKKVAIFLVVVTVIVVAEITIGASVISTQKAAAGQNYIDQLAVLTNRTIGSIANLVQIFEYSVIRTSAAIGELPLNTFVGQEYFDNILQLNYS